MSNNLFKNIYLKPHESIRLKAGHPWIYSGEIANCDSEIKDGEWVRVMDSHGKLFGCGFYNSLSKIRVRLLSFREESVPDREFFYHRILSALQLRRRTMPQAISFRLVNAESDFLSGLIIDKYENILILQTTSLGMDNLKPIITEVLETIFHPRAILEKNDSPSRSYEGMEPIHSILYGSPVKGEQIIHINHLQFKVNFDSGHKTGCYLDQQLNYQKATEKASGARVLDCFCFLGGFSLHAARSGAKEVIGIDQSQAATKAAEEAAILNKLPQCRFQTANAFDWLIEHTRNPQLSENDLFDLIILDPPSFTRNRYSVDSALRGYKEIHLRALKLLRPGGTLASFCCSHHVDSTLFQEIILQAAFDAHKILRRTAIYSQSPDHPILPVIPETEYLKGFAFEIAQS